MRKLKWLVPALYIVFLLLPIYWLLMVEPCRGGSV